MLEPKKTMRYILSSYVIFSFLNNFSRSKIIQVFYADCWFPGAVSHSYHLWSFYNCSPLELIANHLDQIFGGGVWGPTILHPLYLIQMFIHAWDVLLHIHNSDLKELETINNLIYFKILLSTMFGHEIIRHTEMSRLLR